MTPMVKTQVYLPKKELEALHREAKRSRRSVASMVREAVRQVWLRPQASGPVGLWDGKAKSTSAEHDGIYDRTP
jgi:hypothetical protein